MNDKNGKRKNLLDIDRQKKGMDKKREWNINISAD